MKNRKGFMLLEYIVSIGIAGIIMVGGSVIVYHLLKVTREASDWSAAVRQAQNVGYWVSQDVLSASVVQTSTTPGVPFVVIETRDSQNGDVATVSYSVQPSGTLNSVVRQYAIVDFQGTPLRSVTTEVASDVYNVDGVLQADGSLVLTVGSRSGTREVVRIYQTAPRPNYQ